MTGYELSRVWFDFCFENTSKIKPAHTALYFFVIEHNNRLGWKKEFGLPRQMAMDAIGIKNNRTFTKIFSDLEEWGFIDVLERSRNQYSANVIALSNFTPAGTKALDKAMHKHVQKQSIGIAPIDKQYNSITIEPNNYGKKEFLEDWNELRTKHLKKPSFLNSLTPDDLSNLKELSEQYSRANFKEALVGLFKQRKLPNGNTTMQSNPSHFLKFFNSYLTAYHDKNNSLYGKEKVEL